MRSIIVNLLFFSVLLSLQAQNMDIGALGESKAVKVNGGVSANSVFHSSDRESTRGAFTYFLQGNLSFSWLTFNMPVSYSFTNQGGNLDYSVPFDFNRLSLHPKYKWVQGHIGDVAMSFSPYTLHGHQFTGAGLDLSPEGPLSLSLMGGRLLKAVEDDGNVQTLPAYRRMGYGIKVGYAKERYRVGLIGFHAKDDRNSIGSYLDDRGIAPRENLVMAVLGEVAITGNFTLSAEYSSTAIAQDTRATGKGGHGGLAGILFRGNGSTEHYGAIKAGLDFQMVEMQLGLGYERIDPGYETLGAYYFNNDFENITVNGSRPLFGGRVNLSFNLGYQRDDLENQKQQSTSRFVGSVNGNFQINEKVVLTGSYSNFSTYTNQKLDQFDEINDSDLTDEDLEALDYKQLSQNANVNLNWTLAQGKGTDQNLNLNYSLASSANEQDGVVRVGQANNFHNANAAHTLGFPKRKLNITTSANFTYSDIGRDGATAYGGSVNINKKFFEEKLKATFGAVHNISDARSTKTHVTSFRINMGYIFRERHSFSLNAIQLFKGLASGSNRELTLTFGYSYGF